MRLLVDAHLDLSWNALSFDRDQTLELADINAREQGMTGKCRTRATVSLPEMRKARAGICLATILCRAMPPGTPEMTFNLGPAGDRKRGEIILREELDFASQMIASATGQGQLAYYKLLEEQGWLRMIRTQADLEEVRAAWDAEEPDTPIGYILSMEGCDPMITPKHAEWWFEQGLRTACIAHYGWSAYAMGTGGDGPLTPAGRELVKEFDRLGLILDLVHTADTALDQALEIYQGPVFCSHGNSRTLVDCDRQLTDDQIRRIIERDGVIGAVCDAWMIVPGWQRDAEPKPACSLENLADHIDHICQLAGNARHVGIGSDLDGGFGWEQTPKEIQSIAHLHKLDELLAGRGWSDADREGFFNGNWLRFFGEHLPKG
ncbi:MAG: membrane dipeptidase [Bryobacterales bacterium]|nr:membrane dipeptidase [Acidobacteriota bacterium]MCB9383849.1 membrane dipeptidase [Bryobacterales bacterium]